MTIDEVNTVANRMIRKYDWSTKEYGYGIRLTVTDGDKSAGVVISKGESIEGEINRLIKAVDAHQYKDLEG